MTFTAIKLFFSGALEWLLKAASAAFEWLLEEPWRGGFVIVSAILAWTLFFTLPGVREQRDEWQLSYGLEKAAHAGTVINYRVASAQAQRAAEENAARVETEMRAINQEQLRDYQTKIDAVRARYDRLVSLRDEPRSRADRGRADTAGLSDPAVATGRIVEAAGDPRLPAPRAGGTARDQVIGSPTLCPADRVCLSFAEALIATEQALQLDALITVVERQAAVPVTSRELSE